MALSWEGKGKNKQMSCFGILLEVNGRAEIYLKDLQSEAGVGQKPLPGSCSKSTAGTEVTPAQPTGQEQGRKVTVRVTAGLNREWESCHWSKYYRLFVFN